MVHAPACVHEGAIDHLPEVDLQVQSVVVALHTPVESQPMLATLVLNAEFISRVASVAGRRTSEADRVWACDAIRRIIAWCRRPRSSSEPIEVLPPRDRILY